MDKMCVMKNSFYLLLMAAVVLGASTCSSDDEPSNTPTNTSYPASDYDGIWVSDSITNDQGKLTQDVLMWEILNSHEILFHGNNVCQWLLHDQHWITLTMAAQKTVELEAMSISPSASAAQFYLYSGDPSLLNLWDGGKNIYMYRLPSLDGEGLPVTEANLKGKWRYGYEINKSYDADGNVTSSTRFNNVGYEVIELKANEVMVQHNVKYSYNGYWVLDVSGIPVMAMGTGTKPSQLKYSIVSLKSNYFRLATMTFDSNSIMTATNEKFYFRMQ